jgi:shikimate kinase
LRDDRGKEDDVPESSLQRPGSPPRRPRRVWLIGSMGAGKTAVGRELATRLGCDLFDNDTELLRQTGQSLTKLADRGWNSLHQFESAQLRAASTLPPPLVAGVAASVADRPGDLELLRATGVVVYLQARPATLAARVGGGEGRPWLQEDPEGWLAAMLERREPSYIEAAHVVVRVDDLSPEMVADHIMLGLNRR